jgi:hypothetical protein
VLERSFFVCYTIVGASLHDVSGGGAFPVFGDICYSPGIFLLG